DLLPRGPSRVGELRPAAAAAHRPGAPAINRRASLGDRRGVVLLRFLRGASDEHHPGVLRLPDRVHAEPARAALRRRPHRSGEVGHADARALVLGLRLPEFQLSPGAPLLPRRALLPAPAPAAGAGAVLRAKGHAMADVWRALVRVVRAESRAAHGLERGAGDHSSAGAVTCD